MTSQSHFGSPVALYVLYTDLKKTPKGHFTLLPIQINTLLTQNILAHILKNLDNVYYCLDNV